MYSILGLNIYYHRKRVDKKHLPEWIWCASYFLPLEHATCYYHVNLERMVNYYFKLTQGIYNHILHQL